MSDSILEVRGLRTAFHTEAGAWPAVDGVDLTVKRGEIVGWWVSPASANRSPDSPCSA